MGLLDTLGSDEGLLGLALLSAGAAKPVRTSLGEGLLGGLQLVQQQRAQREDREQRRLMMEMQRQQMQRGLDDRKRQQELMSKRDQFLASIDPNQGPPMEATLPGAMRAGLDPREFAMLSPQQADPMAGFDKINPKDYTPESLQQFMQTRNPAVLRAAPKDDKPPADWQLYQLSGAAQRGMTFDQWDQARRRAGATNVGVTYGAPVAGVDAKGNPVFMQPDKTGGPPAIVPGIRPPMSAAEERAAAEKQARERQGKQMMAVMDDAKRLLERGGATASGVGTVADAAGRAVGVTLPGAEAAARLSALSGWLVANVPRMEGPQSNFDVQNYMVMAGKIGDSTVPIKERLAALETVRSLQRRYAAINGTPEAEASPAGGGSPSIDDLLKKYGN